MIGNYFGEWILYGYVSSDIGIMLGCFTFATPGPGCLGCGGATETEEGCRGGEHIRPQLLESTVIYVQTMNDVTFSNVSKDTTVAIIQDCSQM